MGESLKYEVLLPFCLFFTQFRPQTYRDEVNMGQCYMEFTTYSIFTKGENPFEFLSRSKRDAEWEEFYYGTLQGDKHRGPDPEVASGPDEEESTGRSAESKQAQIETIKVSSVPPF